MKLRQLLIILVVLALHVQQGFAQQHADTASVITQTLNEVVVTATGTAHRLKDVPVQTEVITRKELESMRASSVEEILSSLSPSFDFSVSSMGSGMQLGGLGNGYILILIDGKRLNGDVGGQNALGVINPSRIERIEIVKGAVSALYGSDAIAGVINIITRKDSEIFLFENTSRFGSYGEVRQFNTFQYHPRNWTFTTNFQLKHSDGWQNTTNEDPNRFEYPVTNSVNRTVNRNTDGQLEQIVRFQPNSRNEFQALGSLYYKRIYRPFGAPSYNTYDFMYRDIQSQIGGKHFLPTDLRLKWEVDYDSHAYFYLYKRETWETDFDETGKFYNILFVDGNKGLQSLQRRLLGLATADYSFGTTHHLSGGLEWRTDWLEAPRRMRFDKVSTYTAAAFVQDEWNLSEHLNVTAGLRYTYSKDFGSKLTPKISGKYGIKHWNFRLNYAEGFKTPTLKEMYYLYISQMDRMTLTIGKPNLLPQSSRYFSGSIEYNRPSLSFSITASMNQLDRMIALMKVARSDAPADWIVAFDPQRVRQYQNVNDAVTRGIENGVLIG